MSECADRWIDGWVCGKANRCGSVWIRKISEFVDNQLHEWGCG